MFSVYTKIDNVFIFYRDKAVCPVFIETYAMFPVFLETKATCPVFIETKEMCPMFIETKQSVQCLKRQSNLSTVYRDIDNVSSFY